MKNISVLISVYEKENPDFFDAALYSIYTQSLKPDEVVICVDGPIGQELTDILEKYDKKYPKQTRILCFEKNRGLGETLADGVNACSNEIVFRMDSDDISTKDRFKKQYEIISTGKYDVVGSNIAEYDEKMENYIGDRVVPEKNESIKKYLKKRNPMNHQTVCFLRSKVLSAGNYKKMKGFEDYYLWARMLMNGCLFYNIQENLVNVRSGYSLIMRRGEKEYLKCIVSFEKEILKIGLITKTEYLRNITSRIAVSSAPVGVRKKVYSKILRKAKKEIA